jgi:hypothetical protein
MSDLYGAAKEGAVQRIRPKIMTICAILFGLLPIMWSPTWQAGFSIHEDEIRRRLQVLRLADRAGGAHDTPAAFEQRLCEAQANSAGSAGDDRGGFLGGVHRMYFWLNLCCLR